MMMRSRQNYLFLDQYGEHEWAHTVKELREKCGGGHISKMYNERPCLNADGTTSSVRKETFHVGYVVGQRWFTQFAPVERPA
jgi:hypothetical protein